MTYIILIAFVIGVAGGVVFALTIENNYWEKLTIFLNRRDEILFKRLRDNKDHRI